MADAQLPTPPDDLKPDAQDRWRSVIPSLLERGPVDLALLKTYCQVWTRWQEAESGIAKTGSLVMKRGVPGASPLIGISNQARSQLTVLEQRLGIVRDAAQQTGEPMSLRSYAKRRGVSVEAVSKAVERGRLEASVTYVDGKPKIADPDLADEEWEANTDPTRKGDKDGDGGSALVKASAEEKQWRARQAELNYRRSAGELVSASDAQAAFIDVCATARNKLLGLPNRLKQAFPDMALEQLATLDTYIRESLEELANG